MDHTTPLRIGVLGAARIAPSALVRPARGLPGVEVTTVAARDRARAEAFARRHGVPRTSPDYAALVEDPDVDAVYNPLPNGLHGRWTLAAIAAGKHVLCEKPFTANATEAETVARAAEAGGTVVAEAFHYRYHPLARRLRAIVASGELGTVQHLELTFSAPLAKRGDIRYRLDLAGGATMDMGCYPINLLRFLAGSEPTVVRARAKLSSPGVDRAMRVDLTLPDGVTAEVRCSMFSSSVLRMSTRVVGTDGELRVFNPFAPQHGHRLTVDLPAGRRTEHFARRPTYAYQLEAFAEAVRSHAPMPISPADAVANMAVIDAVYEAAGLPLRQPSA